MTCLRDPSERTQKCVSTVKQDKTADPLRAHALQLLASHANHIRTQTPAGMLAAHVLR